MSQRTEANRPIINDEVVAFNHINYVKVEPISGPGSGVNWTSVYCLDIGGMVAKKFKEKLMES